MILYEGFKTGRWRGGKGEKREESLRQCLINVKERLRLSPLNIFKSKGNKLVEG